MMVKYWQAALLAAMMALAGNAAWAEDAPTKSGGGDCCKKGKCCAVKECCKDGACCKNKESCKNCECGKDKDCCKNCECGKGKGCACCKSKECCKGACKCCDAAKSIRIDVNEANTGSLIFGCECCKSKDCAGCKSKECCKGSCKCCDAKERHHGTLIFGIGINSNGGLTGSIVLNERNFDACATKCKQAKNVAIGRPTLAFVMPAPDPHHADGSIGYHPTIVKVVPAPVMPLCVGGPIAPPCVIHHGPLPGSHCVVMPHPLPPPPPMLTPPGLPVPTMTSPVMPPRTVGVPPPPPPPPVACCPCPMAASPVCTGPSSPAAPATNAGPSFDNCVSVLSIVSDLCCAHTHPTSLPGICLSSLGMLLDLCPQSTGEPLSPERVPYKPDDRDEFAATLLPPPRPDCPASTCVANGPPQVVPCIPATPVAPAGAMEVRVVSKQDSDQLEMSIGDDSCMSCKKMSMTVGASEITLTRLDNRVRVRGECLRATAACVRTDRKNRFILEGDVHLRYDEDDQHARISAECIELDLTTGSVTIKPADSSASYSPVRLDYAAPSR